MTIQRATLDSLLLNKVCEIRFVRRRPRAGDGPTRRMLCTKSYNILNSVNGRTTLNFRPPSGPMKVNEARDNLIVVWDILMQDYRAVSMASCNLIQDIAADDFWEYFNENIYPMSKEQKYNFMNS